MIKLNNQKKLVNEIDFHVPKKKGKKPQKFLVLDCETATLPFVNKMNLNEKQRQKIAIAKPLIYDIAWQVVDRKGYVYSQHSFLVQETFFVPQVFNTAYYREKRPLYIEKYNNGEITAKNWNEIAEILLEDCKQVDFVGAYNSMFDYKKAIPFTERYIENLYSNHYQSWENSQYKNALSILEGKQNKNDNFDSMHFNFRNYDFPMFDLWGMSCNTLINEEKYKTMCIKEGMVTKSGTFFKTSAESTFRFLLKDIDFIEEHTALADTLIEIEILKKSLSKKPLQQGLEYFPFQNLGFVDEYIMKKKKSKGKPYFSVDEVDNIIEIMYYKLLEYDFNNSYATSLETKIMQLENWKQKNYGDTAINKKRFSECYLRQLEKQAMRIEKYMENLQKDGNAYTHHINRLIEIDNKICTYSSYVYGNKK